MKFALSDSRASRTAAIAAFWIVSLVLMIGGSFAARLVPGAYFSLAWGGMAAPCIYLVARWFAARSNLSLADAGLAWGAGSLRRFVQGVALGLLVYGVTIAANAALFGPIRFSLVSNIDYPALLLVLAGLVLTIAMEELVFRSYAFWNSVGLLGSWGGQGLIVVAFSLLHLGYGWPLMTVISGVLPSAVLFGAAAIYGRGLALPFGVHLGLVSGRWLAGEGDYPMFAAIDTSGMNVSSAMTYAPLLSATIPLLAAAVLLAMGNKSGVAARTAG